MKEKGFVASLIFLFLYALYVYCKPNISFTDSNKLKRFGLGTASSTILPLWLVTIILGILSYFLIEYYTVFG